MTTLNTIRKKYMVSVRLPQEMENRLGHLAEMTRRPKSFYIKEALDHYFDDMEDAYIALERIARPNRKYYTTKELLESLSKKPLAKKPSKKSKK